MFDDIICLDKYGNTIRSLAQWDLGQTLYIYNTNYSPTPMFHYSNQNTEKALVVQAQYVEGVLQCVVPNQLMIEPYPITCYIYIPDGERNGTVVGMFKIPVRPRPEPNEFEYEDNIDIINIRVLAQELEEAEFIRETHENTRISNENTRVSNENTRISNEATRQEAYGDMVEATADAVTATNRANTAASGAETIISRYETDMATIVSARDTAVSSATAASTSATNAATSEANAATSETNAAASATSAAGSATDAHTDALSANESALKSEGWAVETQNGQIVTNPSSPYYHNSAKYWADKAQAIAQQQLGGLSDVSISNPVDGDGLVYDSTTNLWVNKKVSHIDEAIADIFDDTLDYDAGDIVIYNDGLYRFTTDHDAGPWDDSEVESVSVEQLIEESVPDPLTTAQKNYLIALLA